MTIHRSDAAPESDEQYVREVIDSAMSGTRPPLDLPSAALVRGRRLRTRRRVGHAAVGVAASILAAAAIPWVAAGGDRPVRGGDVVATQPPAPILQGPKGWWDMPATDMVSAVEAILPDGVVVTDPGPLEADTPEGGPASGWINPYLESASGSGRLNVSLYPDAARTVSVDSDGTVLAPSSGPGTGCEAPELSGATACVDVQPGDEAQIVGPGPSTDISCAADFSGRTDCEQILATDGTVIGRRLTNHWGGTVMHEVVLRREGGTVYAASANTLDDKWSADSSVSAPRPPLTLDDLENLVRNDTWVSYVP